MLPKDVYIARKAAEREREKQAWARWEALVWEIIAEETHETQAEDA